LLPKRIKKMIAAEIYEKTLRDYGSLPAGAKVSLHKYCKERRVSYSGLRHWMQKQSRKVSGSGHSGMLPSMSSASLSFVPVTVHPSAPSGKDVPAYPSSAGLLKGVHIVMSNGVKISIREISGKDMLSLIPLFKQR